MEALTFLAPVLVGFATAALILAVMTERRRDHVAALSRISSYHQTHLQVASVAPIGSVLRERPTTGNSFLRGLLGQSGTAEATAAELAAADLTWQPSDYLTIRMLCAVIPAVVAVVAKVPLAAIPLALIGFQLPRFYVRRRQQRRLARFDDRLVDALTLMANALKSGSSFLQAVSTVTRELDGPLCEEFEQVVAEISVGTAVDVALENLSRRVPSYDLFLAVTAMLVQRQTGGNLSEILEKIAGTIRERMRLLRQVRVLTAQERMSAMVIGALPICLLLLFTLLSPAYPRPFFENPSGRMVLGAAFGFEVIGFVVLNRMANLDV